MAKKTKSTARKTKPAVKSKTVVRKPPGRIVAGTGSAVSRHVGQALGQAMENAMVKAINDCMAEGITDPDVIRARQLTARETAKAEWEATQS